MADELKLSLAEFAVSPGGRYKKDYEKSGEEYYDTVFGPALREHKRVVWDVEGCKSIPSSFMDEVFDRAVKEFTPTVKSQIQVVAATKYGRVEDAAYYLDRAIRNFEKKK